MSDAPERATVRYGAYLRLVADDPDIAEGDLRAHMRDAAAIIEKQTEALDQATTLTGRMARQFGFVSLLLWLLTGFFVARWLDWI